MRVSHSVTRQLRRWSEADTETQRRWTHDFNKSSNSINEMFRKGQTYNLADAKIDPLFTRKTDKKFSEHFSLQLRTKIAICP